MLEGQISNQSDKVNLAVLYVVSVSTSLIIGEPLVFAADCSGHRVQVFNANTGAFIRTIGSGQGSGAGQMSYSMGVCILPSASNSNADPMLYVADYSNSRIQVFNANTGAHVRMIGSGQGSALCVIVARKSDDGSPFVYVGDASSNCIKLLS